jgi:rRNA-processing protein FCF1
MLLFILMTEKLKPISIVDSTKDMGRINFIDILSDSKPIIFDTNFLFVTFEFNIDIIEELKRVIGTNYTLYIYEGTILELLDIEKQKTKNKKYLSLISKMLQIYNFKVISSKQKYIDDQILENIDDKIIIATNDKELRLKLWELRSRVLYMRQKKYLEMK